MSAKLRDQGIMKLREDAQQAGFRASGRASAA
jgi:hypothetical protein